MEKQFEAQIRTAAQIITMEHFTLQGARNAKNTEANGRLGQYIRIVGSGVVALAFVANVFNLGPVVFIFALMLLPVLISLGLMMLIQTMQISLDDARIVPAINRIRHFYVEEAPETDKCFNFPHHDDQASTMDSMIPFHSRLQGLLSTPGPIILISSVLATAFGGLLAVQLLSTQLTQVLLIALVCLVVALLLQLVYSMKLWSMKGQPMMEPRFPENRY